MNEYGLLLEDKTRKKIKKIRKKNLKKIGPHWPKIALICTFKIFESYIKSFLFYMSLFSFSKPNTSLNNYFNGAFYQAISPIKDMNKPIFMTFSIFSLLFVFFFFIPFDYGVLLWFSNLTQNKSTKISVIFSYYKNIKFFFRSIFFKFEMYFRFTIPILIFLIPEIFLFIYTCIKMQTANENEKFFLSLTVFISMIILIIGISFFCKFGPKNLILPYLQIQYLYDDKLKNMYKTTSKNLEKLTSSKYFNLIIPTASLLFLLQPLVVPTFFVLPYFSICVFSFSNNLNLLNDQA